MTSTDTPYLISDEKMESMFLGAVIASPQDYEGAITRVLSEDTFCSKQNRFIFKTITRFKAEGKPFDIETIYHAFKTNDFEKAGGLLVYLSQITALAPPPSFIEQYGFLLKEMEIRRAVIGNSYKAISRAQDPSNDVFDVLDESMRPLIDIHEHLLDAETETISEQVERVEKDIVQNMNYGGGIRGIKTGINAFDERLGGLGKGRMITIAGRPGTGKTAFAVQLVSNICLNKNFQKLPVVFYTLEMSADELIYRFVSCLIRYPYSRLTRAEMDEQTQNNCVAALKYIKQSNLVIVDNLHTISDIANDIKHRKAKYGIELAIIDYIQLIDAGKTKGDTPREQVVSGISRRIKRTAKDLQIPIVSLAQLNRETDKRNTKKPILSDLRESGSLEQDSDSVTFTYRPLHAGFTQDENGQSISAYECWLTSLKNRHGPTGEDEVYCDIACNIFKDAESYQPPQKNLTALKNFYESEKDETPF